MTHDEMKNMLGVNELHTVTREQVEQELDTVLDIIDAGNSPVLIVSDGEPDLLMFGWSDYKQRFSLLYQPGEIERIEEELRRYDENNRTFSQLPTAEDALCGGDMQEFYSNE